MKAVAATGEIPVAHRGELGDAGIRGILDPDQAPGHDQRLITTTSATARAERDIVNDQPHGAVRGAAEKADAGAIERDAFNGEAGRQSCHCFQRRIGRHLHG